MCEPVMPGGGQPHVRTMLGRSAVSYQNIGPGSGIFSGSGAHQMSGGSGHAGTWASQRRDTGSNTQRHPNNRYKTEFYFTKYWLLSLLKDLVSIVQDFAIPLGVM